MRVAEGRPSLGNALARLVILSLFIPPLLLLLPLTIPAVIVVTRRKSYFVDQERVAFCHGVFYRHQTSILHSRLDSLKKDERLLNKLFGNGNVTMLTAGSSKPDLVLRDAREFSTLYDAIRARYGGAV